MIRMVLTLLRPFVLWGIVVAAATVMFRRNRQSYAGQRKHFLVTQGGGEFRITGDEFSEAVVSVLMGGAVIDLRNAGMGTPPRRLDVMSMMGGIEVLVPEDWAVRLDVLPLLGGARDARADAGGNQGAADLIITGKVIMGGLEVRTELPKKEKQRSSGEEQQAA
ncbi:MAG: hypothetical protein WD533_04770 [Dehalococcoidia bacterium]